MPATSAPSPAPSLIDQLLDAMRFRCIGPPRGGRVVAVAGDPVEPAVFYFGAVAGGIWKTEDAGVTWTNVSDGYLKTSSVGALAVSDSDPNVIYAGMGESTIRADVSHGDGVWKSTDRGRSWVHVGLAGTRHVSEIRIHPRDPDRVWVAALGHAFGPHPERGVYRSTDGGASWERVLYRDGDAERTSPSRDERTERTSPSWRDRSERISPSRDNCTGAADLALDTRNPSILYASLWTVHRNFWELASGGPGSGLWRSTDSGTTWIEITANLGLPATAVLGKIGVAASPARDGRVWALVESDTAPGLYRSEDFGETWTLASDRQDLRYRPWYYMHVFADPQDENTVYVNNLQMWKSTDAGAHFTPVPTPHGDNHDLWIDPHDNRRMIQGNDGGANVSFNTGASWSSVYNQLTAQLYTVDTDGRAPHYLVYGTQQDNSSIGVPSGTNDGAITWADCRVAGTGESGYVAVDPRDPDVLYVGAVGSSPGGGGALQRYDHRTGQIRLVNVWPEHHGGIGPGELRYRFGWTFPIRFSPHDPKVLYTGGNRVFRSTDEGQGWEPISPDLTRAAADKLGPSGGPITLDTSGAEHYCTLYTLAECAPRAGRAVGGVRRRPGAPEPRRGTKLARRDAAGPARMGVHPHRRALAARARRPLPRRHPLQARRPRSLPVQDRRLRRALAGDHRLGRLRDPARRLHPRDPGRSALPRRALRRHRDRALRLARRRRDVAALALELPGHPGLRPQDRGHGSGHRDPRAFVLDPRRPDPAASGSGGEGRRRRTRRRSRIRRCFRLRHRLRLRGRSWLQRRLRCRSRPRFRCRADRAVRPPAHLAPAAGRDGLHLRHRRQGLQHRPRQGGHLRREPQRRRIRGTPFPRRGRGGADRRHRLLLPPRGRPPRGRGGRGAGSRPRPPAAPSCSLAFLDAEGALIREFRPKPAGYDKLDDEDKALDPGPWMPVRAGVNRFVWDLRYPGAMRLRGNKTGEEAERGPLVLPGTFQVRLTVGERTLTESFEVVNDPRSPASLEDLREQLDCLLAIRDRISAAYAGVRCIRETTAEIERWCTRLARHGGHDAALEAGRALCEALAAVESALILPGRQTDTFGLNRRVRLNAALASVISIVDSADARPTSQARALAEEYMARIDGELDRLKTLLDRDLGTFNDLVSEADLPPVDTS